MQQGHLQIRLWRCLFMQHCRDLTTTFRMYSWRPSTNKAVPTVSQSMVWHLSLEAFFVIRVVKWHATNYGECCINYVHFFFLPKCKYGQTCICVYVICGAPLQRTSALQHWTLHVKCDGSCLSNSISCTTKHGTARRHDIHTHTHTHK